MVILDELDGLKRKVQGKDAKEHLRHALHEIARRFERPHARSVLVPADDERLLAETTIEVFLDDVDHIRLTRNDTEIADRARCLADVTCRPVCIVTNDNGMATRARMLDLLVKRVDYPSDFA